MGVTGFMYIITAYRFEQTEPVCNVFGKRSFTVDKDNDVQLFYKETAKLLVSLS